MNITIVELNYYFNLKKKMCFLFNSTYFGHYYKTTRNNIRINCYYSMTNIGYSKWGEPLDEVEEWRGKSKTSELQNVVFTSPLRYHIEYFKP